MGSKKSTPSIHGNIYILCVTRYYSLDLKYQEQRFKFFHPPPHLYCQTKFLHKRQRNIYHMARILGLELQGSTEFMTVMMNRLLLEEWA